MGKAHITGGGLVENLPRVLNRDISIDIDYTSWDMPEIFKVLQKLGNVSNEEMRRTFNCGIGMVLVVDKSNADEILSIIKKSEDALIIGNLK